MFQSCLNTFHIHTEPRNPATYDRRVYKNIAKCNLKKNYMLIVILKTFLSFAPSPVLTLSVSEHLLTVQLKIDYSDYLSCSRNKIEKKIKESLKCYTQNKEKKYFTS